MFVVVVCIARSFSIQRVIRGKKIKIKCVKIYIYEFVGSKPNPNWASPLSFFQLIGQWTFSFNYLTPLHADRLTCII